MTTTVTESTARIAENARVLAAFLDTIPAGVEPPTHMSIEAYRTKPEVRWLIFGEHEKDQARRAAAILRALGGHWDKRPSEFFAYATERMGVEIKVVVDRAEVCRRVVTGTREVSREVPDPTAPTVTVTETVEDVEWVCEPLLAEVSR